MAERPSAASRLQRQSPVEASTSATVPARSDVGRVLPVRVSAELPAGDYEVLREFAHVHRLSHTEVLRRLVGLLNDPTVAGRVRQPRSA